MNDNETRTRGRPTLYSEDVAEAVLARISNGETLRAICRDPDLPSEVTIRRWGLEDREGFSARLARAWELRAEHIADELLEIADDGTGDTWIDDDGEVRVNNDVIQRSKLRVDTRKWLLSKLSPKKFGDKTQLEHTGSDGGPLDVTVRFVDVPKAED